MSQAGVKVAEAMAFGSFVKVGCSPVVRRRQYNGRMRARVHANKRMVR